MGQCPIDMRIDNANIGALVHRMDLIARSEAKPFEWVIRDERILVFSSATLGWQEMIERINHSYPALLKNFV